MTNYDQLVAAYEVDVRFPDVSGMEHLEMLCTRSDIARGETHLTAEQRAAWPRPISSSCNRHVAFTRPSSASPISKPGVVNRAPLRRTGGGIWMCWPSCLTSHPRRHLGW